MAVVGGFQLVDLEGHRFLDNSRAYPGVYEIIKNTDKPILLCNLNYDGDIFHNVFVSFVKRLDSSEFTAVIPYTLAGDTHYGVLITVEDDDSVRVIGA